MRILITAGPTREYLDDVRFLSNASSGRMGYALAEAALAAGHAVVLVTGPVSLTPPAGCAVHPVETSQEMRDACLAVWPGCDGAIGAAAVCDYRPRVRHAGKLSKTGQPLLLDLVETPDILAELGREKGGRWIVGFALESEDGRARALRKLTAKNCDAIVLNRPTAIGSDSNAVELLAPDGSTIATWQTSKAEIARKLIAWIGQMSSSHSV